MRGNSATTSYFGWDFFETDGPPDLGPLWILDDSSPDLGQPTTATQTRIFQGASGRDDPSPNLVGHVSSTGNYYSFSEPFDAKIAFRPPAGGSGGFTTVVLQLHSTAGGDSIADLQFRMLELSGTSWTLQKQLTNVVRGLGYHWIEWTAPAAGPQVLIEITSTFDHRPVDSFEIDTFWSPTGPVVNAIQAVPEPSGLWLAGCLAFIIGTCRRRAPP
jgi:hypothetical protein